MLKVELFHNPAKFVFLDLAACESFVHFKQIALKKFGLSLDVDLVKVQRRETTNPSGERRETTNPSGERRETTNPSEKQKRFLLKTLDATTFAPGDTCSIILPGLSYEQLKPHMWFPQEEESEEEEMPPLLPIVPVAENVVPENMVSENVSDSEESEEPEEEEPEKKEQKDENWTNEDESNVLGLQELGFDYETCRVVYLRHRKNKVVAANRLVDFQF